MKKRNCRKTDLEREQHDRAIRIRKMTDAQLCEYIDGLTQQTSHTKPEEIISNFLDLLTVPFLMILSKLPKVLYRKLYLLLAD